MSTRRCGEAGEPHGIANAGYRAIDACRMEKGYLYWSGDITPDYNPYEAGLGFCVALDKGDFIGREALREDQGRGRRSASSVSFTVDGFAPFHGGEAILHRRQGRRLDHQRPATATRSARPSPSAICRPSSPARRDFEIEAFGKTYAATRGPRVLYDPKMERLKA